MAVPLQRWRTGPVATRHLEEIQEAETSYECTQESINVGKRLNKSVGRHGHFWYYVAAGAVATGVLVACGVSRLLA